MTRVSLVAKQLLIRVISFHRLGFFGKFEFRFAREELDVVVQIVGAGERLTAVGNLAAGGSQGGQHAESTEDHTKPVLVNLALHR